MERIINISVNGYTVTKDGNVAGVKGEDNATTLVIDFSEDWDKCAKTITFWNALGYNPVGVILGTNLLTDIESSTSQYQTSIPGEALKHSGKMKFTIDGYTKEKRTRSVEVFLDVLESQEMESDPVQIVTPTQAEMLQAEIDGIMKTIQNAATSATAAAESAGAAATSAGNAIKSANEAAEWASDAKVSAAAAASDLQQADGLVGQAALSAAEAGTSEQNAAAARDEAAVHSSSASVYAANAKMSASQAIGSAQNAEASAQNAEMSATSAEGAAGEAREIAAGLEGKLLTKEDKPTIIDLIDKVTTVQALLNDGHLDKYVADDKTYIVKFGKTNTNEYIDDSFCCYGRLTVRKDLDTLVWSDFRVERIIQEFKFLPLDASLRYPNDEDFRPATYIRAYTMDEVANYYWTEWETDVVDLLDSYSTTLPLSANQGRVLRERVAVNEIDISDNKLYINENATAIAKNSEDINRIKEINIPSLGDECEILHGKIDKNAENIATNRDNIKTCMDDISQIQDVNLPAINTSLNGLGVAVSTLENIIPQDYANALKGYAKGKSISVDDVSPNSHYVKAKVSGKNLFGLAGRVEGSLGGNFSPSQRTFTGYGIYYAISGSDYYSNAFNNGFSDKYSYDENTNTLTVTSSAKNYGLAIDISVKPSTTYTINGDFSSGSYCYISQYDKDGYFIKTDMKKNASIKTEPNAAWVLIVLMATTDGGTVTATNLQFEEGGVATEYEPYIDVTNVRLNVVDKDGTVIKQHTPIEYGLYEFSSSDLTPETTIIPDIEDVNVELEYNQDINDFADKFKSGVGYPITPQIDITVEEAVRTMTITQIDGIPLKDYNFTAMRVYVANSPQEEKTTTEFIVNIDSAGKKPYLSAGTGFICATSQAYWGGGIDLKNAFAWNMQSGLASPIYRTNIFSSADPIGLITTECFEEIGIKSVVADIPAGTHIQIWFK